MKNMMRTTLTIIIHIVIALIIMGYTYIASSLIKDNFLHVAYEPSGIQMLYFVFAFPVLVTLSICMYTLQCITNKRKGVTLFPFITGLVFFLFFSAVDILITLPTGISFFYYGSLLLSFVFFILNLLFLQKSLS